MKNQIKNPIFRAIFVAAMSLLFNTNANAQSSVTPGTANSIIEGFTTLYGVKVKSGDTVKVYWEYSADALFLAPTELPSKTFTTDSAKVRDTFTVQTHKIPAPNPITGDVQYVRLVMMVRGVKSYGTPSFAVTILPKPAGIKVANLNIAPLAGGCALGFWASSGSNFEEASTTFRFRYGSGDIWRKPNPDSTGFTGMNQSFSRTILGMLSNKKIDILIKVNNSISMWDTIITFTTTPTSTKPVVAEASGKMATSDSVFLRVEATSFNLSTKVYCINTVNKDTLIMSVSSTKMETLVFKFGNLTGNTQYTFKVYGLNSMGTGNIVNITITTQPKLVVPTFTAMKPNVRYDVAQGQYYIEPKVDWVTNSGDKVKRIDVRIYTDSLYQSVPMMWKVSDAQSGLTGPLTGSRIDSDSGRFWYEFVVETEKSIYTSNLLGYDVKWSLVPKNTLSVSKLTLPTGPVQCKLYDMSGRLVSENWIVNPKVNLFSNELPMGVMIAVPKGYQPFRVYNQGK